MAQSRDWHWPTGNSQPPSVAARAGASGFVDNLLPYLSETRDYANSSWAGFHAYVDFGAGLYWTVWLIFAALSAAAILGLLRWRNSDPTLWALTTSGAIMVGIFFLSSLGQQYYSMWLFPLMFTVVLKRSVFHSAGAWFAAFSIWLPFLGLPQRTRMLVAG